MRRVTTVVALALCLVGCGAVSPSPRRCSNSAHNREPSQGCSLGWWAGGQLVVDGNHGTSILVEGGDFGRKGAKLQVLWWPKFTGRRVGNEVEVLDDGKVVATTGRRYRIDAAFPMQEDGAVVVCGSSVTPL